MSAPTSHFLGLAAGTALAAALLVAIGFAWTGGAYFSLDDPYIHLAFADQLVKGHIGASPEIPSVPVSSPVWPLLLVPGSLLGLGPAGVWLVVFGCLLLATRAAWVAAERIDAPTVQTALLFVLAGNLVPLTTEGMEHLLQVGLALAAAASVLHLDRERLPWWGLASIALLPLLRFEGLGVAGLVAVYAAWRGDRRGLGALAFAIAGLAAFCGAVHAYTGHWLPGSVLSKLDTIPAAWQTPEHPWVLALWLVVLLGLLPLGGRPDLAALASAVALGHLVFGRASNHDRYVPYALAAAAVWLWASFHTPHETREAPSRTIKLVVALLLTLVHIPAWVAQPVMMRRTHALHRTLQLVRDAVDAPIGTHDIGMASLGATHPVVDLLGLSNVPVLDGWLAGDPLPAIASEMTRYDAVLAIGTDGFFGEIPEGWTLVAMLEPVDGESEELVTRVAVYATREDRVAQVHDALERAPLDGLRRVAFVEDQGLPPPATRSRR
ncbi:MAG: hypothetical protein EP330_22385 [Deltaproteobacteria bacterium]|nr:MAG: hypothetical protein EP330_22385 [Deltaproteobacteria bacterium]